MKYIQTYERFLPKSFYKEVPDGKEPRSIWKQAKDYFSKSEGEEETEYDEEPQDEVFIQGQEEELPEESVNRSSKTRRRNNNSYKTKRPVKRRRKDVEKDAYDVDNYYNHASNAFDNGDWDD